MTEPTIMKAMDHLDDDLIAAAAERKAAPRLLTKKKFVALLAACLLLVGTFAMMGMEEKPVELTWEEIQANKYEANLVYFDDMIEMYKDNPEMLAYYTKWRGVEFPDPYPAEWRNEDGSMKEFVTVPMLYEAFYDSLQYEFIMDDPIMKNGYNASVSIWLDEKRHVNMMTGVVVGDDMRDYYYATSTESAAEEVKAEE